MRRITNGYLHFKNCKDTLSTCEITYFVESAGMVEFIVEGTGSWNRGVPMIINYNGDVLWSIKTDEDGNNLYEKFPYKVEKLEWRVEYVNED